MNNTITWDHIYFKKTTDCVQGQTIENKNGFLIWNDGEIVFLTSPKNNFGNPILNMFELDEISKLTKMYIKNEL